MSGVAPTKIHQPTKMKCMIAAALQTGKGIIDWLMAIGTVRSGMGHFVLLCYPTVCPNKEERQRHDSTTGPGH